MTPDLRPIEVQCEKRTSHIRDPGPLTSHSEENFSLQNQQEQSEEESKMGENTVSSEMGSGKRIVPIDSRHLKGRSR